MNNPWTPGPWRAERAPFNPNQWAVQSQFLHVNGLTAWHVVATVFGADKAEEASTGGAYHSEQAEANARLIAAAPEMAEALEEIRAALIAEAVAACTECGSRGFPRHSGCDSCTAAVDEMYPSFALLARIRGETR